LPALHVNAVKLRTKAYIVAWLSLLGVAKQRSPTFNHSVGLGFSAAPPENIGIKIKYIIEN